MSRKGNIKNAILLVCTSCNSSCMGTNLNNMACPEDDSLPWGNLIFTHDNKPPVLMNKNLVTLGRRGGDVNFYETPW